MGCGCPETRLGRVAREAAQRRRYAATLSSRSLPAVHLRHRLVSIASSTSWSVEVEVVGAFHRQLRCWRRRRGRRSELNGLRSDALTPYSVTVGNGGAAGAGGGNNGGNGVDSSLQLHNGNRRWRWGVRGGSNDGNNGGSGGGGQYNGTGDPVSRVKGIAVVTVVAQRWRRRWWWRIGTGWQRSRIRRGGDGGGGTVWQEHNRNVR